jgi:hypothetical protein
LFVSCVVVKSLGANYPFCWGILGIALSGVI